MQPNRPKGHHSCWDAVAELARVIVGLVWEAALGKYGSVGNGAAVPPRPVRNLLFNCDHLPCTADGQLLQKIKSNG
ncbi:Bombyxin A-8 [Trichinella pseudospiralis]